MKLYSFSALLARMKYITRWSLMHSTRPESLSEHTCDTALMAHILCLIARRYTGTPCRPKTVAVAALYHDAPAAAGAGRGGQSFHLRQPADRRGKASAESRRPALGPRQVHGGTAQRQS